MFGKPQISPELLLGLGGGILSGQNFAQGMGQGFQNASNIMAVQRQEQQLKEGENRTRAFVQKMFPNEDVANMPPEILKQYANQAIQQRFAKPTNDFKVLPDGTYGTWDGSKFNVLGSATQQPKATDDQREYEMAKEQGFKGTFMEYQIKMKEAGRQQVNIDTGEKLPSGFRWKNPDQRELGVEPIPGGPATQIPAELAARVGMAETFQKRIPSIKEKIKAGEATGPMDVFRGNTMGTNPVYGDIESGVDALRRLLTGAGMNESEARDYSRRYLPTYYDDANTLSVKIDRLAEELDAAKNKAMLGRGSDQPAAKVEDPLGIR